MSAEKDAPCWCGRDHQETRRRRHPMRDAEKDVPDGTTYPWAQDLGGTWHLRPADDPWGDPESEIQAHGQCGAAFASVHVSTYRPTPEPGVDERLCDQCRVVPPGKGRP